ncbi:MAG: PrgI family protein [Raoultibacter sp.]
MASIRIHRDLFNFERKRKGFTTRQIKGLVAGIIVMIVAVIFLAFVIELPFILAINIGLVLCMPIILAGFMPLFGMPADEYAKNFFAIYERGQVLALESEEIDVQKGETTREHKRAGKKPGYECRAKNLTK